MSIHFSKKHSKLSISTMTRTLVLSVIIFQNALGFTLLANAADPGSSNPSTAIDSSPDLNHVMQGLLNDPATREAALELMGTARAVSASSASDRSAELAEGAEILLKNPQAANAVATIFEVADAIGESQEGSLPPTLEDPFHLGGQTVTVYSGNTTKIYEFGDTQLEIPHVTVSYGAFYQTFGIETEGGALSFTQKSGGKIVARHTIPGIDVVAYKKDEDQIIFITRAGEMMAINTNDLRAKIYKSIVPVYQIQLPENPESKEPLHGKLPKSFNSHGDIKIAYTTLGFKPPGIEEQVPDAVIEDQITTSETARPKMGSVIVYVAKTATSPRKIIGYYNREPIQDQIRMKMETVSFAAKKANGMQAENFAAQASFLTGPTREEALKAQAKANALTAAQIAELETSFSPEAEKALMSLKPEDVKKMLDIAEHLSNTTKKPRDVSASLREWRTDYEDLVREMQGRIRKTKDQAEKKKLEAALANEDLSDYWVALYKENAPGAREIDPDRMNKFIPPAGLKKLALATALGAAAVGTGLALNGDISPTAWGMWAYTKLSHLIPVLALRNDPVLDYPVVKSIVVWGSMILPVWAVYSIIGKMNGWTFKKAIVQGSLRLFGTIMCLNAKLFFKVAGQKNLRMAMRNGIRPTTRVIPNSAVGRQLGLKAPVRPAFNVPYVTSQAKLDRNRQVLEVLHERNLRLSNLAWTLANIVVAEKKGIPVPDLILLQEKGWKAMIAERGYVETISTPEFILAEQKLAVALADQIRGFSNVEYDLKKIDPIQFSGFVKTAQETAKQVEARGWMGQKLADAQQIVKNSDKTINKFIADYGIEMSSIGLQGDSTPFVEEQGFRQFRSDWFFMAVSEVLFGARAMASDVAALFANAHGFMWSNWSNGAGADRLQQAIIYLFTSPFRTEMNYGRTKLLAAGNYQTRESLTPEVAPYKERVFTATRSFFKSVIDFHHMKWGTQITNDYIRRSKIIPAFLVIDLPLRMLLVGQSPVRALAGFAIATGLSWVAIGSWWHINNMGIMGKNADFEKNKKPFDDASYKIRKTSRFAADHELSPGDLAEAREGFIELSKLYPQHGVELPKSLAQALADAEKALAIPEEKLLSAQKDLLPFVSALVNLKNAIEEVKEAGLDVSTSHQVADSYSNLEKQYAGENVPFQMMDAQALYDFAMKHPPVPVVKSEVLEEVSTFSIGVIPSTVVAGYLYVWSYSAGVVSGLEKAALLAAGFTLAAIAADKISAKVSNYLAQKRKVTKEAREAIDLTPAQIKAAKNPPGPGQFCRSLLEFVKRK